MCSFGIHSASKRGTRIGSQVIAMEATSTCIGKHSGFSFPFLLHLRIKNQVLIPPSWCKYWGSALGRSPRSTRRPQLTSFWWAWRQYQRCHPSTWPSCVTAFSHMRNIVNQSGIGNGLLPYNFDSLSSQNFQPSSPNTQVPRVVVFPAAESYDIVPVQVLAYFMNKLEAGSDWIFFATDHVKLLSMALLKLDFQ